ncbi:MAG: UDP-N-acetylglucosamine 2-epimerase (non-hydrolyzing) [Treponema sp.]|jgi:UDP-N-acetylglucosamine 2-epimerase (non-hydrolysing)|nr:UDP-N-acetylglucosamine 2-epimerase (non-hydrolyzing) [Treponema sp.]
MKVMTIIGTRPEIIKLAQTLKELDKYTNHIIVHTGQNFDYELNEIFFNDLELRKPDYFLNSAAATPAQTIANVIAKSDEVMEKEKPDAVLIYGDTNSCLSIISAKRRKIPIFHMEAGNRCFDLRVPEEINRKIVDHLADINLVLTEHSRRYLEREGIRPETIIKTGSPMKELLQKYMPRIDNSKILDELKLTKKSYFVVSSHREEVVDEPDNLKNLINSLNALIEKYSYPVIFSLHPRTKNRLEKLKDISLNEKIIFSKPFGFFDYICLQKNAFCVLSDSGTITEESSLLGFPAITIRNIHERPEGNDEATLIMSGYEKERVLKAVEVVTSQSENKETFNTIGDYDTDNVSKKVVRLILSYTEYVNEFVWRK